MTIYRGQGGLGDSYNDPELVHTSGDETIDGVKTFTSTIIGTVSGHYTKAEEDAKLALKANQSTTFTKTEVSALVDAKADQATTYTKTEVDTALSGKLSSADGSVTYAKIQNVTAGKVLGRNTSGNGVVQELPIAVDSSGNLLVGTTDASISSGVGFKMRPAGDGVGNPRFDTVTTSSANGSNVTYTLYSTGAGAYRFYVGAGGTISATSTTITGISDRRLKDNIRDLDDGLDKIMALQPRKFDWKEGKGKGIANDRGFIAQEFETVFPDMIEEWLDTSPEGEEPYKAVNANLIPTLVKAIQEQQAIIEQLKADVEALKAAP